jgi:antitoxin PrlF
METFEVTKLSSKGQVVIPQQIRDNMSLEPGSKFIVIGEGDTIVLKSVEPPSFKDFDHLISKTRKFARKKKLKKSDVNDAIKAVRRKRK